MKDDLQFFEHDNDARNHPKMKALQAEYGREGRCRFWDLNEMICSSAGARLNLSTKVAKAGVAVELGMSVSELEAFLQFLANREECGLIQYSDGVVTTDRTQESYQYVVDVRTKGKERAKQWRANRQTQKTPSTPNGPERTPNDGESTPKSQRTEQQRTNERTKEVSSFASESEFEPPGGAREAPPSGPPHRDGQSARQDLASKPVPPSPAGVPADVAQVKAELSQTTASDFIQDAVAQKRQQLKPVPDDFDPVAEFDTG